MQNLHTMHNKPLCFLALTAVLGASLLTINPTYAASTTGAANNTVVEYAASSSLEATIDSIFTQMPEILPYYEAVDAIQQIHGYSESPTVSADGSVGLAAGPSEAWENLATQMEAHGVTIENPQDKSYADLISLATSSPDYSTDDTFKAAVAQAIAELTQGTASLRHAITQIDPAADTAELYDKNDAELLAIYNNFPAVKDNRYKDIITSLRNAQAVENAYLDGELSQESYEKAADKWTNDLIAKAEALKPGFKVEQSANKDQTSSGSATSEASKPAPKAPRAGDTSTSDSSANKVVVSIVGLAAAATSIGMVVMAKLYLFSPLKRRK